MLQGKGMYLWRIKNVEGGDPAAIAEAAVQAGLTHVLVKVADGRGTYNTYKVANGREYFNAQDGVDHVPAVVAALRARGISPWGWQYIYGANPVAEARMAIQRVKQFALDGFVVNAEIEFQERGMDVAAGQYMRELRSGLANTPIALSSFRYPNVHNPFPWNTFLEYSDLNMPQVYWVGANNPAAQLAKSLREFQGLRVWRPVFPTGAAYGEHGWRAKPAEVTAFLQAVKDIGLPGCNFWEWYFARRNDSELWNPVQQFAWPAAQPEQDITFRYIEALNSSDPVKVAALYNPAGVHVTAQRTSQGPEAILRWYNSLFGDTLPNARFEITGEDRSENMRTLTWIAESNAGRVLDGKDTLGIKGGQIAYHYSYFTVAKP
ncbi:MAG: nuclear transport factor 2 family protein [Anaerolineales bacterium]